MHLAEVEDVEDLVERRLKAVDFIGQDICHQVAQNGPIAFLSNSLMESV